MKSQFAPTNTKEIWVVGGGGQRKGRGKAGFDFSPDYSNCVRKETTPGKNIIKYLRARKKNQQKISTRRK